MKRLMTLAVAVALGLGAWARADDGAISIEEAQARLIERQKAREAATTQPIDDRASILQRLVNRLQKENADLKAENASLKAELAKAQKAIEHQPPASAPKGGLAVGTSLEDARAYVASRGYGLKLQSEDEETATYTIIAKVARTGPAAQQFKYGSQTKEVASIEVSKKTGKVTRFDRF